MLIELIIFRRGNKMSRIGLVLSNILYCQQ